MNQNINQKYPRYIRSSSQFVSNLSKEINTNKNDKHSSKNSNRNLSPLMTKKKS